MNVTLHKEGKKKAKANKPRRKRHLTIMLIIYFSI